MLDTVWSYIRIPLVVAVALLVYLQIRSCKRLTSTSEQTTVTTYKDSTSYYRDRYNNVHAQVRLMETDLNTIKTVYTNLLLTKVKELGVPVSKIQSVTTFKTTKSLNLDSLIALYAKTDTLRLPGRDSLVVVTKNVYIPVYDSLTITEYLKRSGWLKRTPVIDVVSYDTATKVKYIEAFRVKRYQPNVIIGPSLTYGYTMSGWKLIPGVSITYKLIGLRIGKQK